MEDDYDEEEDEEQQLRRHRRCSGMVSTFPARERAGFEQGIGERGIGQGPTRIDDALRAQNARDAAPR